MLSYLQRKLDEFVNHPQGLPGQYPPIRRLRLHNSGEFGSTLPESYYDLQSIVAQPPADRAPSPGRITRKASPMKAALLRSGQLTQTLGIGKLYLNNINSACITANVDVSAQPTPLTVEIVFDTSGSKEPSAVAMSGTWSSRSFPFAYP